MAEPPSEVVLDGHVVARLLQAASRPVLQRLEEEGRRPTLALMLVGEHPAALAGLTAYEREAGRWGIQVHVERLPATASRPSAVKAVRALGRREDVAGVHVLPPLPDDIPAEEMEAAVPPAKDAAGVHPETLGRCWRGEPGLLPATAGAVLHLAEHAASPLTGREAVLLAVAHSPILPAAPLLHRRGARVTLANPDDAASLDAARRADLLVVDVRRPRHVGAAHVRPGAVVVDAGAHAVEQDGALVLVGDVDLDAVAEVADRVTPVPGGLGVVAVAVLLENVVRAARGTPGRDAPGQMALFHR